MKPGQGIRLKLFSIAFPIAIVIFLSVISAALWLVSSSFHEVERVLERRQETLRLTSELSRITELLARLVRAYTATGDTRYLTYYYDLDEYRNGKQAAPAGDPVQYWEEVIAGLRPYVKATDVSGKSFSLRMREAGFSAGELGVLDKALAFGEQKLTRHAAIEMVPRQDFIQLPAAQIPFRLDSAIGKSLQPAFQRKMLAPAVNEAVSAPIRP